MSAPAPKERSRAARTLLGYAVLTPAFRDGIDTPRAFLERCLERIAALDPTIQGFTCLALDRSRIAADLATARWAQNRPLSPMDGMPVGIKDLFEMEGTSTEGNSRAFEGFVATRDAACVAGLADFGAFPIGKTTTAELGGGAAPSTVNPHDFDRTPGGSSSGSAATVAAGMIPGAIGTQLKGSLLRPASYCGTFGYKPSFGSINRGGGITGSSSATTIGTLAGTLDDAWSLARLLSTACGPDAGFPPLRGPTALPPASRPLRIGVLRPGGWPTVLPQTRLRFDNITELLRRAGTAVLESEGYPSLQAIEHLCMSADEIHSRICRFEARWPLRGYIDKGLVSDQLRRLATSEDWMTADDYAVALVERETARRLFDRAFDTIDMLIGLTADGPAPLGLAQTGDRALQVLASYLGAPAFSLPLIKIDELPVGVQVVGRLYGDAELASHAGYVCSLLDE